MNVLVIGSGGREHALVWKITQDKNAGRIFCAPGNAGTASIAHNVPIDADDLDGLLKFARDNHIGLTVVGPEAPLCAGIVDLFTAAGLAIFGPSKAAARLEGSKAFMKAILAKAGAPTAHSQTHSSINDAVAALALFPNGVVIKADGLAAGKGVVVCDNRREAIGALERMMVHREFGSAGTTVVLEEKLIGEEASVLAFCDGANYMIMPAAQDHKRIFDGDKGPNTGGMGAYSPAPVVTPQLLARIEREIIRPVMDTMAKEGAAYRGVLYAGIMVTADGPKTLEFNCRFGDPECQPIMARMKSDILPTLKACADGDLAGVKLVWDARPAVCVVMAAGGYPGAYEKGKVITGLAEAGAVKNAVVFHAGTRLAGEHVVTAGGRVLGVTALGDTVRGAVDIAYEAVGKIHWEGAVWRKDIAARALSR